MTYTFTVQQLETCSFIVQQQWCMHTVIQSHLESAFSTTPQSVYFLPQSMNKEEVTYCSKIVFHTIKCHTVRVYFVIFTS
jgi:hypothetical protein